MIKKFLILTLVAFTLIICGCEQELPPAGNLQPKVETPQPETQVQPVDPAPETVPVQKPEVTVEPAPEPSPQPQPAVETPPAQPRERILDIKVYFPDDAGIKLVAVNRRIKIVDESEKYVDAVKLLMTKPSETDLTEIFPKGAKLNSVTLSNGTAYVDLDKGITKNFVGGSTGEELLINSVVDTLTEFPEVKQVRFLLDGQEIETLAGHMDLSTPLTRTKR